jgi:hypothetical protein
MELSPKYLFGGGRTSGKSPYRREKEGIRHKCNLESLACLYLSPEAFITSQAEGQKPVTSKLQPLNFKPLVRNPEPGALPRNHAFSNKPSTTEGRKNQSSTVNKGAHLFIYAFYHKPLTKGRALSL